MKRGVEVQEIIQQIKIEGGKITSQIIKDAIEAHRPIAEKTKNLYKRYEQKEVPIHSREFEQAPQKINNQIAHDFVGDIVDTKIGYFMGIPIVYQSDSNEVKDFNKRNNIEDLDSETAKMAAIAGYAPRLYYIDKEGNERVKLLDPWEVGLIYSMSIEEPEYGFRYYSIKDGDKDRTRVEWYDEKFITFYLEDDNGEFVRDYRTNEFGENESQKLHLYDYVPINFFKNNREMQGDAEKVIDIIDDYDRVVSDVSSEIEQFRLAYLVLTGQDMDEAEAEKAKRIGMFILEEPQAKMGFLVKSLDDTAIQNQLERHEKNIARLAKTVNFTDEQFAQNLSGVAMKFKIFNLETKCKTAERKFIAALKKQYQILNSSWKKRGKDTDYLSINYEFTRNFPLNLLDEAQATALLRGNISEEKRLSLLSFIDNPKEELQTMQAEGFVDLEDYEKEIEKEEQNNSEGKDNQEQVE